MKSLVSDPVVIVRGGLLCSPEEQSIVHALWDECTLFLHLLLDRIKSVLLRNCQVPKTTRKGLVIRVGDPWWECRCARGCRCGGHIVDGILYLYRYYRETGGRGGLNTVCNLKDGPKKVRLVIESCVVGVMILEYTRNCYVSFVVCAVVVVAELRKKGG